VRIALRRARISEAHLSNRGDFTQHGEVKAPRVPAERYGGAVTARCLELGLNVNIVHFPGLGSVLRIAPPLTIAAEDIDLGLELLDRALLECSGVS